MSHLDDAREFRRLVAVAASRSKSDSRKIQDYFFAQCSAGAEITNRDIIEKLLFCLNQKEYPWLTK